jgi:hypothetical protein
MFLLGLLVLCVEHLSEASFTDDLSDFKVVKNCAPIEVLASECGIDDVSVSKKLQVLVEKIDATFVEDLCVVSVVLAVELLAGLLYEVVQSQVLVQSYLEFFFRLVDTSVQSYYNLLFTSEIH